jgi:hypothetical protein
MAHEPHGVSITAVVWHTTAMSKRLQVVVKDDELERYEQVAGALGMTVSEWVRRSLHEAERDVSTGDVERKLAAVREAVALETEGREADIETMLAETATGRLAEIEAGMGGGGDV